MTPKRQRSHGPSYSDWERAAALATPAGLAWLASNRSFQLPQHLALLDEKLYDFATGRIKRLMVTMPPRSGKSESCSKYFPAWIVGRLHKRVILTSYEASFASSWGRKARDVLELWGETLYGVKVSQTSSAADWWELEGGLGSMMTAGAGGALTGKGAEYLIIDDPLKNAEQAASTTLKDKLYDWYQSTAYTRLEPNGGILLIQTRWSQDDLAGRLLTAQDAGGEAWELVSFPAIAEVPEQLPLLSGDVYSRAVGDPLWPERFSAARMTEVELAVGPRVWSSLYQQRPTPDAGLIWRRPWFDHRYSETPTILQTIQSVDSAFKTGVANDYSVIATWGRTATDYYLLDLWRARVEFPDLKRAIVDQSEKWRPSAILIEDAASGQSAIQELKRGTRLPIIPVPVKASKQTRAAVVSPLAESGKVWLPTTAPWVAAWIEEHIAFPNGEHDDVVDTTSMALAYLAHGRSHASSLLTHLDARLSGKE